MIRCRSGLKDGVRSCRTASTSIGRCFSFRVLALIRRRRSSARLRERITSHVTRGPFAASNRSGDRHSARKTSCVTSSASERVRSMRRAADIIRDEYFFINIPRAASSAERSLWTNSSSPGHAGATSFPHITSGSVCRMETTVFTGGFGQCLSNRRDEFILWPRFRDYVLSAPAPF